MANYEAEVAKGNRAKTAYDLYIKEHIDVTVKNIYDGIESCHVADVDTLQTLKGLLSAIRGLERSILNDIDTGRMAAIALEKDK